jgi:hypothetical protein
MKHREAKPAAASRARDRLEVDQLDCQIDPEATPEIDVTSMLSVTDGQRCLGFVYSRGRAGWEAYDVDCKSLGLFHDRQAAIDTVAKAAGGAA